MSGPTQAGTDRMPVTASDVTDEKLVAGQLRALQREVRDGVELILRRLDRFNERLDAQDERIDSLEERQARTEERLAALERR